MAGLDDTVSIRVEMETSGVQSAGAEIQRSLASLAAQAKTLSVDLKAAGMAIGPSFQNLDQQIKKLGDRYTDTGLIGQRSIAALGVSLKELEKQYGKNADAALGLSRAERQVYANAQATYTDAIKKQREFNDELEKVNRSTHNFTSLEGALLSLGGTLGKLTSITVGVFAAFEAGWAIGTKLDKWLTGNIELWSTWKTKVTSAIADYVSGIKGAYDVTADPRFAGTRTQANLPKVQDRIDAGAFAQNLEAGLQAQGVKTFAVINKEIEKFRDQVYGQQLQGQGTLDKFLLENKSKVQEWAAAYRSAGKEVPADIQKVLTSLTSADAGVTFAKSAADATKATQAIENQGAELQKFIAGLELKFAPPETDPIKKALADVSAMSQAAFAEIADRQRALQQDIETQKAAAVSASAQIGLINSHKQIGEDVSAEITAQQKLRAEALQKVIADQKGLAVLESEKDRIAEMAQTLAGIRQDDALSQMAIKAQKEFAKLQSEIDDIAAKAKETIEGLALPSGLADSINAQIDKAKQTAQNTILASFFFDPAVRAQLQDAAVDFQKAHTDGLTAGAKVLGDRLHKAAEELEHATDKFASDMADLFTAGVKDGAAGFADAASKAFLEGVNAGAKNIFKQAVSIAFGVGPTREQFGDTGKLGDDMFVQAKEDAAKQQAAIMGTLSGAFAALGQTLTIFANAKKGQEVSVLGSTLSFAAMGASIGALFTPLGAAIGAVVGALAGLTIALVANAKARKEQPYAAYGIRDGQAYVEPFPGKEGNFTKVTQSMMNDMLSQMQNTLESTRNDYIKLLMKFPDGVAKALSAGVTAANFAPVMSQYEQVSKGLVLGIVSVLFGATGNALFRTLGWWRGTKDVVSQQGDIGNPNFDKTAQKNFAVDFQNWVSNTLPKAIIAGFEAPLAAGFETLGLTAAKFSQIWDRIQAIDPKDAIKTLNDLLDALTAFKEQESFLSNDRIYGQKGFVFEGGLLGDAQMKNLQSFADALAQADVALVQMGATFQQEIGPQQIADAKAWGDALMQREAAVKQFFQEVAKAIDNVIQSYQASIRSLTLEGFKTKEGTPDVGAQVAYLKKYADSLYGQIQKAPTIEIAQQLSQELQNTILQIKQIGGSQSVEAAEAYRVWAINQLKAAQDLVVSRLQQLAQDVASQNANFLDAIQDFIDAFREATAAIIDTGDGTTTTTTTTGTTSGVVSGGRNRITEGNDTGNPNEGNVITLPPPVVPPPPPADGRGITIEVPAPPGPGRDMYPPPPPPPAPSGPTSPESMNALINELAAGGQVSTKLLERIAENQERLEALQNEANLILRAGIPVDVQGGLDLVINGEDTGAKVPLDGGGFDRRTIGNR